MNELKAQWIRDQYTLSTEKSVPLFTTLLNTKSLVSNPDPQPTVAKRFTVKEAFKVVPDAELFPISESNTYRLGLLPAFEAGRMDWVQDNIKTLIAGGIMTPETAAAIGVLMAQTELDPNWQAQIMASPAELAGFGLIKVSDVNEALDETN